jgi:flavin-dependent dehydrogenase
MTSQTAHDLRADVCVLGAGIVGLWNALHYAKRGFSVVLLDELTEHGTADYKVGESLLVFSNTFLRTIGELDDELTDSFVKQGFWMAYGLEGKTSFDDTTCEWGFLAQLPDRWRDAVPDKRLVRAMAGDVQIVRPDVEAALRRKVAKTPEITFCDQGLARDVVLADGAGDHLVSWQSRDRQRSGTVSARWLIDCTGRTRLLATKFGHDLPFTDGFATGAAWGQFADCDPAVFDERWEYTFPEGRTIRRDLDTVHLWGDGYWVWIIRLTDNRISVGVTVDRARFDEHRNLRDVFWEIVRRYPLLEFLKPENLLQFHAYRDVQRLSELTVSPRRYAIAGDSASIIDALYSQGLSLSLSTSWHVGNIVQADLTGAGLDSDYIEHVNRAALADWRLTRSMARWKYSDAMADSRFFILDHLLDYLVLSAALLPRYQVSRWLTETGGRPEAETPTHVVLREKLRRSLFLTQLPPWHRVDPATVARIAEDWHRGLARRAEWRRANGIHLKPARAVLRADAAVPYLWRLAFPQERGELTPKPIIEPGFVRVKGTEVSPPLLVAAGNLLLAVNLAALAYDVADTAVRRAERSAKSRWRAAVARGRAWVFA